MTNNLTMSNNRSNNNGTNAPGPGSHNAKPQAHGMRNLQINSFLWLKRRVGKYPQLIIFLAIVDILVSIFFLVYWVLTVLMILLIFTTRVETAEETEIETEHLEILTILFYILHPTFYTLSTVTAIMLAQGIEKLETHEVYTAKKGCVCWMLQSFFHCLHLEFVLIFYVVKLGDEYASMDPLSFPLFCFHFLWKVLAMLVIGSFLAFSLLLLWNQLQTSGRLNFILRHCSNFLHGGLTLFRNLICLKYLGWALPLILCLLHCSLVLIFLQYARKEGKRPGALKEAEERKRRGGVEALICFMFLLGSLQWHIIRSGELLLMDFFSSIVDILFRLFCLVFLLRHKRGSVMMGDIESAQGMEVGEMLERS